MTLDEYREVKDFCYREYCDYLHQKYGKPAQSYMLPSFEKSRGISRTSEGLVVHHVFEDTAILLSTKEYAQKFPFEWQCPDNLVYCDYLEHLLLHVLICESPKNYGVGIRGAVCYLIPELNDWFGGFPLKQQWKVSCYQKIKGDVDCYIEIVNRLIRYSHEYPYFNRSAIESSFDETYSKCPIWHKEYNKKVTEKFVWDDKKEFFPTGQPIYTTSYLKELFLW